MVVVIVDSGSHVDGLVTFFVCVRGVFFIGACIGAGAVGVADAGVDNFD